ncbi:hypothetical protein [Mesobacterium pallidum]|uniref:hypothetical protein n=1 Tax=Mesobacterium pallidum TaxID=2872037 RepID=UPI001EE39B9D|nr:hypothetical protein [Mesobacterium pallidum]
MLKPLAIIAALAPAAAQATCGPHRDVAERLTQEWGEQVIAAGVYEHSQTGRLMMVEVWAAESGSFTIISRNAEGTACMIVSGQMLTITPLKTGEEG